jgi:hypothetical protein
MRTLDITKSPKRRITTKTITMEAQRKKAVTLSGFLRGLFGIKPAMAYRDGKWVRV